MGMVSRWLAEHVAAKPVLSPYPGWSLGAGLSRPLSAWARRQLWLWVRSSFDVEWLEGLRLNLDPRNETSRAIFVTGRYEPNEFCVLARVLQPGMTFVDVGANMGLYAMFAARKVVPGGTVLAIEPSSREYEKLVKNIETNRLGVRALRVAVSDRAGGAELLVAPLRRSGHNTLGAFGYDTPLERKETVALASLDQIVAEQGLQRLDVIKMDVEGAELLALRGATRVLREFRPLWLLEISDRALQHQNASSRQIFDLLAAEGYRVFEFDTRSGLPQPLTPRPWFDSENVIAVAGDSLPW
jgi:FkbM family methyltransferase